MSSKKTKKAISATTIVKYAALVGNAFYILWLSYKGLSYGFQGTPVQIVTYLFLLFLLGINIYILVAKE